MGEKILLKIFIGVIFALLFAIIEYLLLFPMGFFFGTYIFLGVIAVLIVFGFSIAGKEPDLRKRFRKVKITLISFIILSVLILLINSPILRADKYKSLLPTYKEKIFSKEIDPFDVSKAPIVTQSTALQIADRTVSQDGTIGSRAEINSATLQNVDGRLYYVVPLEHSGFFAWFNNRKEGTPFIMVDANNKEFKLVKSHIRFQPSSYFSQDLARKLFVKDATKGFTDFTFEVDDQLHPYWTASIYKNSIGFSGKVVTGTAVVNAETGVVKIYSVSKTPKWVDRIQPEEIVVSNINYYGEYIHGFSPFNDNKKFQTTDGTGMLYNDGKCYYYSGLTSVGKDESTIGFMLIDSRTMKPQYFRLSGATETAARKSAEGKVQNLNYTGSFPILLNVENKATYFIPLQDKNKLTKMYAMVSVEDHTILGTGDTVDECKEDYLKALYSKNQLENTTGKKEEITGVVNRIGSYSLEGNTYYTVTFVNNPAYFSIPLNESVKLPVTKEGDTVKIQYVKRDLNNNNTFNAISFENLTIQ